MIKEKCMQEEMNINNIMELTYGFWESRIFLTAVETDIFSAVGKGAVKSGG
jgi:hypothetical protein